MKLAALAIASLLSPSALAQAVHVVAPVAAPGVDFTSLQAAIAGAGDGDVILLRPGSYARPNNLKAFVINHKGIAIVADTDGPVVLESSVEANLSGQDVLLSGIDIERLEFPNALDGIVTSGGALWLEDASVTLAPQSDRVALRSTIGRLIASRSVLHAPRPAIEEPGGSGLVLSFSDAALYGGEVRGGTGGRVDFGGVPQPGGAGVELSFSFLYAQTTELRGGDGAKGRNESTNGQLCSDGAEGAAAVLGDLTSRAATLSPGAGGAAGDSSFGSCHDGPDGPTIVGAVSEVLDAPRTLTATRVAREGETATLTVNGVPGDFLVLLVSGTQGFVFEETSPSIRALGAPFKAIPLGFVPASGERTISTVVKELGVDGVVLYLQFVHVTPTATALGTPAAMTLLDGGL